MNNQTTILGMFAFQAAHVGQRNSAEASLQRDKSAEDERYAYRATMASRRAVADVQSLDELHFRYVARPCFGLFVGVADGDDDGQLVVRRDIKSLQEELALLA